MYIGCTDDQPFLRRGEEGIFNLENNRKAEWITRTITCNPFYYNVMLNIVDLSNQRNLIQSGFTILYVHVHTMYVIIPRTN